MVKLWGEGGVRYQSSTYVSLLKACQHVSLSVGVVVLWWSSWPVQSQLRQARVNTMKEETENRMSDKMAGNGSQK